MEYANFRISLNVNNASSNAALSVKQGDNGRRIYMYLTEDEHPYLLRDDLTAVLMAKKPDGTILYNYCTIEKDAVVYNMTTQTTAVSGRVDCELRLYSIAGEQITSARFIILVNNVLYPDDTVISMNEATELQQLISDSKVLKDIVEKNWDSKVDKEEGKGLSENDFTAAYKAKVDCLPLPLILQWSDNINEDRREENEPVLEKLSKAEDGKYHVVLRDGGHEYPLNRREYTAEDGYFYYFGGEMHETYAAAEYVVQYKPANKLEGAEYNLTRRSVVNSQRLEEFDFRPPTTDLVKIYLDDHTKDTDIHVTAAEKAKWNAGTGGTGGGGSAVIQEITLPAADWVQENNTYRLDVSVPGVTSDQYPCISLHPDSVETAHAADMSPCVQTESGILRFFAGRIPGMDLHATAALLSQGVGNSGSYVLPTATATRLGGVRVGENIQVTEDGTVSVDDTHMLDKMSATAEEVQEMLTEVFDS